MGIQITVQNISLFFGLQQSLNLNRRNRRSHQSTQFTTPIPPDKCPSQAFEDHELSLSTETNHGISSIDKEELNLRNLNDSLVTLAAIFPDVQIEVFREMLMTFDEESRLAVVTESLLKHKTRWVKGRYRVINNEKSQIQNGETLSDIPGQVSTQDKFRSTSYKRAVKRVSNQEFKGLSRTTINSVLAEFNYSYTLARPTLVNLSSKSWRYSLSSLFKKRNYLSSLDLAHHPLAVWQSNDPGSSSSVLSLRSTGCSELDKELTESLITPINQRFLAEQEGKDYTTALELNITEAEQNEGLYDCECCFTATTFEQLSACDGGHFICFQCIRHCLNEAVFGQGWQRSINLDRGTLRCVAVLSDDCPCSVPPHFIQRAFSRDKSGSKVLQKLDERLAEDSLLKCQLPLIRCPFCNYAEVDELYIPESQKNFKLKYPSHFSLSFSPRTVVIHLLGVIMIPLILIVFLLLSLFLLSSRQTLGKYMVEYFNQSVNRIRRKRLGLKFSCRNKCCGRESCRSCYKEWSDIHICHESSIQDLRNWVELAMSLAIKRTCPRCNTSFVKTSGCNKFTCICGYQMCYVCRKNIGNGEGYRHFCEHFRPNGGRNCSECVKCDLYRCEDDEVVVRKAKQEAERQWIKKERSRLGCDENLRKVLETTWKQDGENFYLDNRRWRWNLPDKELIFDALIESLIVIE